MSQPPKTPIVLTPDEWAKMTARRRAKEKEDIDNEVTFGPLKFLPDNIPDEDSYRAMVEAFINGKKSWEAWQATNQSDFCDFEYLRFIHKIDMKWATFTKEVGFSGATFTKEVDFSRATFIEELNFSGATFTKEVDFSSATFIEELNFSSATFTKVNFSEVTFTKEAEFGHVTFAKGASFDSTRFTGRAYFISADFTGGADFISAEFTEGANFSGADFTGGADFIGATFTKDVSFAWAIFIEYADFGGATFTKVDFSDVLFTEKADFGGATFTQEANFIGAIFFADAYFKSARFSESAFFNYTKFAGKQIDFSKMILSSDSNLVFEGTKIYQAVPDFRYLTRIPDIRFHKFSLPSPKELLKEEKWDKDYEDMYRKLKELAIANHNHEYELKFHGYEMESKIINAANAVPFYHAIFCNWCFPIGLFSHALVRSIIFSRGKDFFNRLKKYKHRLFSLWLFRFSNWYVEARRQIVDLPRIIFLKIYKYLSNYGQSIMWPMVWLAVMTVMVALYNSDINREFLFKNFVPVLPFPFFVGAIVSFKHFAFKTIASLLWFLLGLGIRNNFKIK